MIYEQDNKTFDSQSNKNIMVRGGDPSLLFFALKVAIVCVVFWNHFKVRAFQQQHQNFHHHCHQGSLSFPKTSWSSLSTRPSSSSVVAVREAVLSGYQQQQGQLFAASGRGMGMGSGGGTAAKSSKNKKGGKSKSKSTSSSSSPFDVGASLIRLEKKYDQLALNALKEFHQDDDDSTWSTAADTMMTSEYVIAARASTHHSTIADWVPIAQLCLKRPESEYEHGASDSMVQIAISAYRRELSHVAAVGSPVFSTIARNELQYSVESVDSFRKFVYDEVIEGKANQNKDETMTKVEARKVLGLSNAGDTPKADIKQAYRRLSFDLHPDRFEGTPEECGEAAYKFSRVKIAYETLTSGIRGHEGISWYESLGGRARTGFVGPVDLMPLSAAQEHMERHRAEGAIIGLDRGLVQSFVARHLRSE
jgi:hypothetical protein